MKGMSIMVLGDAEQEYIDLLADAGLRNVEAKVIVAVACSNGVNLDQIAAMTSIKCSTISLTVNDLTSRKILRSTLTKVGNDKARKTVYLNGSIDSIVDTLTNERIKQTKRTLLKFNNAKAIARKVIG